ncbi:MAG: SpoIIE family protein phosphatase [Spirochaetales bacterium]|nr:SpoIIE family protein phosphatase [Spirochaetales bacterium]
MNIRPKLVLLQLAAVTGFIIALSVIFFYSQSIIKQKNFQIHSEKVLAGVEQIKSRLDRVMVSNVDLFDQKSDIIDSVNSFGILFNQFRDKSIQKVIPEKDALILSKLTERWIDIYETSFLSLFSQMDRIIVNPYSESEGSSELIRIRYKMVDDGDFDNDFLKEIFQLEGSLRFVGINTYTFITDLENELVLLSEYTSKSITRSMILAVSISIITVIFSILIITIFSRRMGSRIIQIRDAIQSLSMGDFSRELDIKSGDEFENFSNHYNVFKNELWEKLESVLDFMLEISGSISIESNLDRVLEIVIDSAVKNTTADAGSVFLVDENDDSMIKQNIAIGLLPPLFYVPPEYANNMDKLVELVLNTPILTGETIIGKAVETGGNFFIRDVLTEEDMEQNQKEGSLLFISSIMVVPLIIGGRVLGTLVLSKNRPGEKFTDIDFNHIRTFSDYAALTIDNIYNYHDLIEKSELHREIRIAADIQKNLLPGTIPDTKGLSFAAFTEAARGVSGDYYDFFRLDKDKSAIIICDVVGKGVPASLLMIMIRTIIRLAASPRRDAAQILTILNKAIIGRTEADQFATMSFIIYDESKKELAYSNAAHAPLLHYRSKSGTFLEIDTPGLPIGIESSVKYEQKIITLEKDDILALYTDGITEARNRIHKEYSQFSLQRVLKNEARMKPAKIIDSLRTDLKTFVGDSRQHDDQTLLILKAV